MHERDILLAALEKARPEEREAYLTQACGTDRELRGRVDALLQASDVEDSFLEMPAFETAIFSRQTYEGVDQEQLSLDFLHPADDPSALGRLGPYSITEVVGRGGMGVVLKARDAKLNRVVAVKVMAPELAANPTARKRFEREAHAAAAVVHQHVVTIHAVEEDRLPYLVMEYVDGQSLQQKIDREGHLTLIEILRIGQQVATGLAAAHANGLMHRDVKPANILLENGVERVRITDFGLARAVDDVSVSHTGDVAGTPQYMSPEQAQGLALDARSDLFSFGSVLYAMCTGRSPFRAQSTIDAIRRVCDATPRPIQEVNPEIPDWLVAIIDRLLAKQPDERFQTAAEVAELLGQHLAQLQHPGAVTLRERRDHAPRDLARGHISRSEMATRHRWLMATAVLALFAVGFSLTEATSVTQVVPTVIRIVMGEGTLVIETDPDVQVTIEGNGDLTFILAGGQSIRVPTGTYRVKATKDGKPIRPEKDLVTITRGDRQAVRVVRLEHGTTIVGPIPIVEKGAFVLMGGAGGAQRRFDTLAQAVQAASDGDTIEIRGNGPFLSQPISIHRIALTIRAAEGFRPVIKLSPEALQQDVALLTTSAALVLEGLELHRAVSVSGAPLQAANCRFRANISANQSPVCVLRNCEFLADDATVAMTYRPGARVIIENCLHRTKRQALVFVWDDAALHDVAIQIKRSTFVSRYSSLWLPLRSPLSVATDRSEALLRLEVSGSLFDAQTVLGFWQARTFLDQAAELGPVEAEATVRRLLQWRGERNVFVAGATSVEWYTEPKRTQPPHGPKSLEEWKEFWGTGEPDSLEGSPRFQGGDLLSRTDAALNQLTPGDFRLREGSAGYRAGPDGKDLGADVDLVGPGAAYERWKQTPEYQTWLKDTGQLGVKPPPPEPDAFVLLAAGVESKFDTLAEAVQRASDGDTIEIRGNGPFVTPPVIINRALAIRAAAGYRPVIRLAEGGQAYALLHSRAPLTLEGLEFQWPPRQQAWKPGQQKPHIVFANGNSLHVANCCFRTVKSDPNQPDQLLSIGAYAPTCSVRNCEFFSTVYFSHSISTSSRALVLDNCLHLRQSALVRVFGDTAGGAEYVLSRNTVVRGTAIWFGVQIEDGQLSQAVKPVDLVATGNLFDAIKVVHFFELERKSQPLEPDEAESLFPRLVAWNGRENVYPAGSNFLLWWSFNGEDRPGHGPKDLEGWKQYWNSPETGSAQGRFRYQGGDLVARFWDAPEKLTAGDFRLRPDSAGYRAGPDGKDLGADVDLVGPGAAYERWKKTPEYQTWLKDTGQLGVKPPPPEVGAFVLLAAGTERKFDTLAAAVLAANDGDTIEIRGNGPFVTRPVMIDGALAIRAGASYRPVIRLAEGGQADAFLQSSAPLTLEGLEFQWPRQQASKPGQLNPNIISANGNSLHVANCCFRMDKSDPNQPAVLHCIGAYSPTCSVRNCEFFSPLQGSFSIFTTSRAFVLDNCVHLAQCSMARNFRDTEGGAEYVLSRNTVVNRGKAIWFGVQIEDEQLSRAVKPVDLVATGNLFDAIDVVLFGELERKSQPLEPDEAESLLRRLVAWNGRENVYPAGSNFLIHWNFLGEGRPDHGPRDLEGWKQYWNSPETASAQGRFRYQGGDLVARFAEAPEKLTADDFRLREDSAGYRAGPDGKDLGADVDLVGPGPAYERWKKMPEYEDWLKETGQ